MWAARGTKLSLVCGLSEQFKWSLKLQSVGVFGAATSVLHIASLFLMCCILLPLCCLNSCMQTFLPAIVLLLLHKSAWSVASNGMTLQRLRSSQFLLYMQEVESLQNGITLMAQLTASLVSLTSTDALTAVRPPAALVGELRASVQAAVRSGAQGVLHSMPHQLLLWLLEAQHTVSHNTVVCVL